MIFKNIKRILILAFFLVPIISFAAYNATENKHDEYGVFIKLAPACYNSPINKMVFKSTQTNDVSVKYNTDISTNTPEFMTGKGMETSLAFIATEQAKQRHPILIAKFEDQGNDNIQFGVNTFPKTQDNFAIFNFEKNKNNKYDLIPIKTFSNKKDFYSLGGLDCSLKTNKNNFIFDCACY